MTRAFSLAASGVYLVDDADDAEADRAHPTKHNRPIAAGIVPAKLALAVVVVLRLGSLALSWLASTQLVIVPAVYIVVQLAYCFWLKHQLVLDTCIVASGFLLRAIGGGAATGIPLSRWFLLTAGFGSLSMVAGKRYAEMMLAERTGAKIRKPRESYSASYLRFVWALSATVLTVTYRLWAFEIREAHHNSVWSVISIVPFVGEVRCGFTQELVLHAKFTKFSLCFGELDPFGRSQGRLFVGVLIAEQVNPVAEGAFIHAEFSCDLDDRTRGLDHQPYGFVTGFRTELAVLTRQLLCPPFGYDPIRVVVREQRGTSHQDRAATRF